MTESWITYERALLKISFTSKDLAKVDVFVKHKMVNTTTDYDLKKYIKINIVKS